ncbi:hypothetical protein [Variovorax paradoxus]|uniref:hypothetical protein n=1 Tax=Variovorax paradoxus TaxID=34073 RepID=UPI00102AF7F5|nr:hypothetical protein RZE77_09855 [Variovorax paradoxus]
MTSLHLSHYALLQVGLDAGKQEIEQAYLQRLARLPRGRWRRQLWLWATGEDEQSLQLARDTLQNQSTRKHYDRKLALERWHWIPMT